MNIAMSGLDFSRATVEQREKCAATPQRAAEFLVHIKERYPEIKGCALLATCNRTELYLSLEDGSELDPARAFALCTELFVTRRGEDCARYLAEVACGLRSQIFGDDQIVTQVGTAIALAREAGTADGVLETLFRIAVSAAKAVKTKVRLTARPTSAAALAVERLEELTGGLSGMRALVIGNGEMGRLAAEGLWDKGCAVTVTLRTYRHGETRIPAGCAAVPYDERYQALEYTDILVSATSSPHFTVNMIKLGRYPRFMVDLALPRDIDPRVAELRGVTLLNIDDLHAGGERGIPPEAEEILQAHLRRFFRWCSYREQGKKAEKPRRFPLFIDLNGQKAVVIGGGRVACRRIAVLRDFGADITVISPKIDVDPAGLNWRSRPYGPNDLAGAALVVAATDDRAVNHAVALDARALGIPVSVADAPGECTFFFPAVCLGNGVTAGVVSDGYDHLQTVAAARIIRTALEELP